MNNDIDIHRHIKEHIALGVPYFGGNVLTVGSGQRFSTIQAAVNSALSSAQYTFTAVTGTVSVSLDGKTVTGTGTSFLTAFAIAKSIEFNANGKVYGIKSVASNTTLRLVAPAKEAHTAVSSRSAVPVMRTINIMDSITEDVFINATGLTGGAQIDNVALSFYWADGAQHSGVFEYHARSGILQYHCLQQVDRAESRLSGKVGPTDPWPMLDLFYDRIVRRSVDGVDFIYNTNTQRVWMNDCWIEGNFDILMPFCSGEVLVTNSTLRSMPNDEADSGISNQALSAVFTSNDGLFIANNSTFWAGCYGAGACYCVNLAAVDASAALKTGCVFNFNHCTLIAEKVPGSTEVASTSFAFVNLEANAATINIEGGTNFQFLGSPTAGASWRNFRPEATVASPATVNIRDSRPMQGLATHSNTFFTVNHVDNLNIQTLAYAATITPNANLGNRINVGALTGALTMNAPTNPQSGQTIDFSFVQDATGGRVITWNAIFKKAADGAGTASQRGSTFFRYDGTNWIQQCGALTYFT